jgi:glycerol-3-phosphate acyltransferase PlsY
MVAVWSTRYVSLGSVMATAALAPLVYVTDGRAPAVLAALATAMIVIERHRANLARLHAGTERRIGQRA